MKSENLIIEKQRSTPIKGKYDVIVAGGGTAGVVAALAAARNGAKVILVEKYGFLGGTLINGACAMHSFFNMFGAFSGIEKKQLVKGIPQEIVDKMIEAGGCPGHIDQILGSENYSVITPIDHEIFKYVILKMMEEANVNILLHTLLVDTIMEDNVIKGVIVESKFGREAILSKIVIDTTGDGDVAYKAGAVCLDEDKKYGVGFTFSIANVDIDKAVSFFKDNKILTNLAYADKGFGKQEIVRFAGQLEKIPRFKNIREEFGMGGPFTYSIHKDEITYTNCSCGDPLTELSAEGMTKSEIEHQNNMFKIIIFLKENIPGFEKCYISWESNQIGIRRTRIIECEYDLSPQEIEGAARFDDEIGLYGFHDLGHTHAIKNGGAYGIPYRALVPKKIECLLVAGRMITSNWTAHMSTRNTVSCMLQGQAVGTAATLSVQKGTTPRNIDVNALRNTLINDGVYLGD